MKIIGSTLKINAGIAVSAIPENSARLRDKFNTKSGF